VTLENVISGCGWCTIQQSQVPPIPIALKAQIIKVTQHSAPVRGIRINLKSTKRIGIFNLIRTHPQTIDGGRARNKRGAHIVG